MAPKRNPAIPSWEDELNAAMTSGQTIEAAGFFKFAKFGDRIVGKLLRIDAPRGKAKSEILQVQTRDGKVRPVGKSGNLVSLPMDGLIGHVISIWYVEDQDVDQPSPMKVYKVIDHGSGFPALESRSSAAPVEDESDDELPF